MKTTILIIVFALLVAVGVGWVIALSDESVITYTDTTIQQKYVLCEDRPEYFILCDGGLKYQIIKDEYASVNVGDRVLVRSSGPFFEIVQVY